MLLVVQILHICICTPKFSLQKSIKRLVMFCEPARPLQRSLGPFAPEMPKKSRKCLPGPPAPEPRKVSKQSREQSGKSPESVERVFSDCSRDFLETFRGSGAGGPGRHFRDFFGISGAKGPRDLCKGRTGSQVMFHSWFLRAIIHCSSLLSGSLVLVPTCFQLSLREN